MARSWPGGTTLKGSWVTGWAANPVASGGWPGKVFVCLRRTNRRFCLQQNPRGRERAERRQGHLGWRTLQSCPAEQRHGDGVGENNEGQLGGERQNGCNIK